MSRRSLIECLDILQERAIERALTPEGKSWAGNVYFYDGYAEPGYSDPDRGIIALGNWNSVTVWVKSKHQFMEVDNTMVWFGKALGKLGVECEWCDEWTPCNNCGKLFRTSPDSYCWQPAYVELGGDLVCHECVDPEEYLATIEGNHRKCNQVNSIDPEDHGYVCLRDDFEHGFHRGQDASPELIAKILEEVGIHRYLFQIDSTGQFDVDFSVWAHQEEEHLFPAARKALETGKTDGPSVSAAAEASLKDPRNCYTVDPETGQLTNCDGKVFGS